MPEVSLAEIEIRMGFPRDYLDFTLWYLLKKGYIAKADNAQYQLTAEGVDFVESQRVDFPNLNKMLTSGSDIDVTEVEAAPDRQAITATDGKNSIPRSYSSPASIVLPSTMGEDYDRRFGKRERRIGLPDLRRLKAERRIGIKDRRANPNGPPTTR